MFSGTTLTRNSGKFFGAHQKIDKIALKKLDELIKYRKVFPDSKAILHFEGKNGPDGVKRKGPSKDDPKHFYSPFDVEDSLLINVIRDHYNNLVKELKDKNQEKIAFEAAWLAHALVDGLTPAHHYPYEKELSKLKGGEENEIRTAKFFNILIIPGTTTTNLIKNNWKMWGPKGLMSTHGFFEYGVAFILAPLNFESLVLSRKEMNQLKEEGLVEVFQKTAKEIAVLDIYHRYIRRGWTPSLAMQVRNHLGPTLVKIVAFAWYSALVDAGIVKP